MARSQTKGAQASSFATIGRKIALAVGLPVVLAGAVGVGLTWDRTQRISQESAAAEASALADLVVASFPLSDPSAPVRPGTREQVHRQVTAAIKADALAYKHVRELRVINRDGIIRWSRRPEEQGQVHPEAARLLDVPAAGYANPEAGEHVHRLGGMVCASCHSGDAFRMGAVQVQLSRPGFAEDVGALFRAVLIFILALLGGLVLAISLGLHLLITRPLGRLIEAMGKAEKGDFLVRARIESRDEIGRLANAFNSMLSKITEMKVAEIETGFEMQSLQRELTLKEELERKNQLIELSNQTLAKRLTEMSLLLDIGTSLNSTLELKETLNRVTERVGVALGVDQFAVMLLDEKGQQLSVVSCFGMQAEALAQFRLEVGTGASGIAAQTRETVYLPDVRADPRYVRGPADPDGEASLLCVPMICKEALVGVLNFIRFRREGFTPEDTTLLRLVANQAAMAIVNARLYTETRELTLTDALTGVFNRRHLFARLEMEVARAQRFGATLALVMIDIDHFKHLNDTCGHPAGDKILVELAGLLQRSVRKVDTVARYGGEEFMVLLPQITSAEALEVAEKLRRAVEANDFPAGDRQPGGRITISVGVGCFPMHGQTLERAVDAADAALYASKRGGRNRVTLFADGMDLHPGRHRSLEHARPEPPVKAAG